MKNIILATLCTAIGAAFYMATLSFPTPAEEYRSPSVYPRAVIGVIVVLSVVLVAVEFLRKRKASAGDSGATGSLKLPLELLALMGVYYVLMQIVGFCTATFAFLLFTFIILGGKFRPGILFSAGMTAGQYVLFVILLEVRMPDPVVAFLRHAL